MTNLQQIIDIQLVEIKGIDELKKCVLNDAQQEVVTSVVNNGQQVPIIIDSKHNVLDGNLRIRGCIDGGQESVKALVCEDGVNVGFNKYIINGHRRKMSATERAESYVEAVNGKNSNEEEEIALSLNVKSTDVDMKTSKSHKSKFNKINMLPKSVRDVTKFHNLGINTSYELAKQFVENILTEEEILEIIKDIVKLKLTDKKSIEFIKKYKSPDIEVKEVEKKIKEEVTFKKTSIIIDITKYLNSDFTVDKINKTKVLEAIDILFAYLKEESQTFKSSKMNQDMSSASNNTEVLLLENNLLAS